MTGTPTDSSFRFLVTVTVIAGVAALVALVLIAREALHSWRDIGEGIDHVAQSASAPRIETTWPDGPRKHSVASSRTRMQSDEEWLQQHFAMVRKADELSQEMR